MWDNHKNTEILNDDWSASCLSVVIFVSYTHHVVKCCPLTFLVKPLTHQTEVTNTRLVPGSFVCNKPFCMIVRAKMSLPRKPSYGR